MEEQSESEASGTTTTTTKPSISSGLPIFHGDRFKYGCWRTRMMAYLDSMDLSDVITDENPNRTDSWKEADKSARHKIVAHLGDSTLLQYYKGVEQPAREIIAAMDADFLNNPQTALDLRFKLEELPFKRPLHQLFNEFESLLSQLAHLGWPLSENDKIFVLINKMPPQYRYTVQMIRMNTDKTKHTLEHVMQLLKAKERVMQSNPTTTSRNPKQQLMAKRGRGGGGMYRGRGGYHIFSGPTTTTKNRPRCMHCDRLGHVQADCRHYKKFLANNHLVIEKDPFEGVADFSDMKYEPYYS